MAIVRKTLIVLAVILILLALNVPFCGTANAEKYENLEIPEDQWWWGTKSTKKGHEISYDVEVVDGSKIDVYIMPASEYEKYKNDKKFNPVVEHQKIYSVDGKYETPDDQQYYVIVDNWNNANHGDANPEGDVVVNMEIEFSALSESEINTMMYLCCGGITIVIVIIAVTLVLRRKKKTVVQPPYMPQYQQPPVYRPPAPTFPPSQQYQQPPQYPPPYQPQYPPLPIPTQAQVEHKEDEVRREEWTEEEGENEVPQTDSDKWDSGEEKRESVCPNCGSPIDSNWKVCPHCETRLE